MKYLSKFNESTDSMRKFVVTTKSESSDNYIYFIEHPTEPTRDELKRFLRESGSDFDDERTYENIESIREIKDFQRIPK